MIFGPALKGDFKATTKKIMEFMAPDEQPFSVGQVKSFVDLMSPRYK